MRQKLSEVAIHLNHGDNASWVRSPDLGEIRFTVRDQDGTGVNDINSRMQPESTVPRFTLINDNHGAVIQLQFDFEEVGREFIATRSGGYHGQMWRMVLTVLIRLGVLDGRIAYGNTDVRTFYNFDIDLENVPESWLGIDDDVRMEFEREAKELFSDYRIKSALTNGLNREAYSLLPCPQARPVYCGNEPSPVHNSSVLDRK
jgi:hypothetical protein